MNGLNPKQNWPFNLLGGIIFYIFLNAATVQEAFLNVFVTIFTWAISTLSLSYFYWLNAVNLTDGIDGLASISVAISLSAHSLLPICKGNGTFSL